MIDSASVTSRTPAYSMKVSARPRTTSCEALRAGVRLFVCVYVAALRIAGAENELRASGKIQHSLVVGSRVCVLSHGTAGGVVIAVPHGGDDQYVVRLGEVGIINRGSDDIRVPGNSLVDVTDIHQALEFGEPFLQTFSQGEVFRQRNVGATYDESGPTYSTHGSVRTGLRSMQGQT